MLRALRRWFRTSSRVHLRQNEVTNPADLVALIDRFMDNKLLYKLEWDDFDIMGAFQCSHRVASRSDRRNGVAFLLKRPAKARGSIDGSSFCAQRCGLTSFFAGAIDLAMNGPRAA